MVRQRGQGTGTGEGTRTGFADPTSAFDDSIVEVMKYINSNPEAMINPLIGELGDIFYEKQEVDVAMKRLSKDLSEAAKVLPANEARYLVDLYYILQKNRIRMGNELSQIRKEGVEPNHFLSFFFGIFENLENKVKSGLAIYANNNPVGRWCMSQVGVGPVISAGLLAHIDISRCPTAGKIWAFAGLAPNREWLGAEKAKELVNEVVGKQKSKLVYEDIVALAMKANRNPVLFEKACRNGDDDEAEEHEEVFYKRAAVVAVLAKRPYNATLKTLCTFKMGESFVKTQNRDGAFYGRLFVERKLLEWTKNRVKGHWPKERGPVQLDKDGRTIIPPPDDFDVPGAFADQAAAALVNKSIGKDTDAYGWYSRGMLPPAHIHARARRYSVSLFLSHYHYVAYKVHFKEEPPKPFVESHLHHVDILIPPNIEVAGIKWRT